MAFSKSFTVEKKPTWSLLIYGKCKLEKPLRAISKTPACYKEEDICYSETWQLKFYILVNRPGKRSSSSAVCDQMETLCCFESDQTQWALAIRAHQWAPVAGLSGGAGPCFQIPGKAVDWGQFVEVWESPRLAPSLACLVSGDHRCYLPLTKWVTRSHKPSLL